MRWITFSILLYLAAALDLARFGSLSPAGHHYPSIQYICMLAIFYALYASEHSAPLAALVAGLALDLLNADTFGIYTLSLGLVAWAITKIRLSIFREHMVSQLIVVLIAVFAVGVLSGMFREVAGVLGGGVTAGGGAEGARVASEGGMKVVEPSAFGRTVVTFSVNALYTALLAPAFFWVLFRFQNLLGFGMKTGRKR